MGWKNILIKISSKFLRIRNIIMTQEVKDKTSDEHSHSNDEEMEDAEDTGEHSDEDVENSVESSNIEYADGNASPKLEEKPQYGNQKKEKKKEVPIGKTRIWKQSAAINSLLKKGRLFEIRKLLKRLSAARAKRGSEAQLAKN